MTIPIRQSELDAAGFGTVDFSALRRPDQKVVATRVLLAMGRNREALLLEMNNVIAVNAITYVQDISRIGQR